MLPNGVHVFILLSAPLSLAGLAGFGSALLPSLSPLWLSRSRRFLFGVLQGFSLLEALLAVAGLAQAIHLATAQRSTWKQGIHRGAHWLVSCLMVAGHGF